MRPGISAKNMQKRIVLVLFTLFLQPLAIAETTDADESREAQGGHAILLEQYTATWCDSCATIDPWIIDFVDAYSCLLYTSPSPRDATLSRMPSSA